GGPGPPALYSDTLLRGRRAPFELAHDLVGAGDRVRPCLAEVRARERVAHHARAIDDEDTHVFIGQYRRKLTERGLEIAEVVGGRLHLQGVDQRLRVVAEAVRALLQAPVGADTMVGIAEVGKRQRESPRVELRPGGRAAR